MNTFKKIILVGTTQILYDCGRIVKRKYPEKSIMIIDIAFDNRRLSVDCEICSMNKKEIMQTLADIEEDTLVLSIMNPYLFPEKIVGKRNLFMVNLHHALLPKHPGRNAEAWAIWEGEHVGGITWHLISDKVDSGDIIKQKCTIIKRDDTSLSLLKKYNQLAEEALEEILPLENLNEKNFLKQDKKGDYLLHYSDDRPNNGMLDLKWDTVKIVRFLRAMDYGILNVMGKMIVEYGEQIYEFSQYKIQPCKNPIVKIEFIEKNGMNRKKKYLLIYREHVTITLINLRKVK